MFCSSCGCIIQENYIIFVRTVEQRRNKGEEKRTFGETKDPIIFSEI